MPLTNAYLITSKNLAGLITAMQSAKAPERFNNKFLIDLGFSSSNDRLFIGVLKSLKFIDESGVPIKRYFDFLDQTESARVLAEAVRDAYEDLFAVNTKANELSEEEVKNKLRTLTQGTKSDNVVRLMAATFKALTEQADFGRVGKTKPIEAAANLNSATTEVKDAKNSQIEETKSPVIEKHKQVGLNLRYDIHIHLPESRDVTVYDAIFQALNTHLGK
jgi:hypothetical protein